MIIIHYHVIQEKKCSNNAARQRNIYINLNTDLNYKKKQTPQREQPDLHCKKNQTPQKDHPDLRCKKNQTPQRNKKEYKKGK